MATPATNAYPAQAPSPGFPHPAGKPLPADLPNGATVEPEALYPHLLSPLTVRGMTIKNRLSMAPMGTNYAEQNGEMSFLHIDYYEQRAMGGTGLIIVENASIYSPEGSNGTTQLRLDHDSYIPRLYLLCERVHKHGARIAVQLNHAGASAMESRTGVQPVSASNLPSKPGGAIPRPLAREEIYALVKKYGEAAKRAQTAGFDAVEIHAGHSYLLCQFLSPTMNDRTDEFGGSPENRARFVRLVLEETRRQVGPQFPILVRISADEMVAGGNTLDDMLEMLEFFHGEADIIDVSVGLNESIQYQIDSCQLPDGWRANLSRQVKERYGKPTITTGNIRSPRVAEEILERGDADIVGMGRGLIADPNWMNKVQFGRVDDINRCISCNIGCAGHRIGLNRPIRCTVNPAVNEWEDYKSLQVMRRCNVVVVGGGTAGLEAACTAAEVGCNTFLIEREHELGGLARSIARIPDKYRVQHFVDYLLHRASKLPNLYLFTGVESSPEFVACLKPDVIVNATGSSPLLPPIEGLRERIDVEGGRVSSIVYLMDHVDEYPADVDGAQVVVVGGGAVGLDVVEFFADRNARITVVEMMPEIGRDLDPVSKARMREIFETRGVDLRPNTALTRVEDSAFAVKNADGSEERLAFDYGFVCLGMKSTSPVLQALEDAFPRSEVEVVDIGDSVRARRIIDGVAEGRNILSVLRKRGFLA